LTKSFNNTIVMGRM